MPLTLSGFAEYKNEDSFRKFLDLHPAIGDIRFKVTHLVFSGDNPHSRRVTIIIEAETHADLVAIQTGLKDRLCVLGLHHIQTSILYPAAS